MTLVIGILGFVVAFGLAVFVHELGHFLAAKLFRVPVERFVIGFDKEAMPFMPRCIVERRIGETTYGLSLVPLGGYVKMTGVIHPEIEKYLDDKEAAKKTDAEAEAAAAEPAPDGAEDPIKKVSRASLTGQAMIDQGALYTKPFWQKTIIYSAGVFMNLVLACLVLTFHAVKGFYDDAPVPTIVGWQEPGSLLEQQDIREGDLLVAFDGKPVATNEDYYRAWGEIATALPEAKPERAAAMVDVTLTFERDGQRFDRTFAFVWGSEEQPAPERMALVGMIRRPAHVTDVELYAPAWRAGIKRGDQIVEINGEPIGDWARMVHIVRGKLGEELTLTYERAGARQTVELTPVGSASKPASARSGIRGGTVGRIFIRKPLGTALVESPILVYHNTMRYLRALKNIGARLLSGDVQRARRDLGGPVAIAHMAHHQANLGLDDFLKFLVMLNIALAVMNILPYPVLDGGHIVLAAWEAIFRAPMSPRILVPVFNWGLIALLAFVVLVTVSDAFKIFGPG
ncbi:MAG: site-2 protease family protein [Candidatus Sumerlaeia bacterium]|nr:site-2 protease family protein [Candidatus Sumerlaeia bacterium]